MIRRVVVTLLLAFCVLLTANAKDAPETAAVADFDTNLNTPAVTPKALSAVKKHIGSIGEALTRKNFNSDVVRKGEVVRLTIPCADFFAPNDTSLIESAKNRLAYLKPVLQQPTMYKVLVAVYTDDTGDEMYADDITWSRAATIYNFLCATADIKEPNVVPYGMGHDSTKAPNTSIKNRAQNRRVEIFIVPEWNLIKDATSGKL